MATIIGTGITEHGRKKIEAGLKEQGFELYSRGSERGQTWRMWGLNGSRVDIRRSYILNEKTWTVESFETA